MPHGKPHASRQPQSLARNQFGFTIAPPVVNEAAALELLLRMLGGRGSGRVQSQPPKTVIERRRDR